MWCVNVCCGLLAWKCIGFLFIFFIFFVIVLYRIIWNVLGGRSWNFWVIWSGWSCFVKCWIFCCWNIFCVGGVVMFMFMRYSCKIFFSKWKLSVGMYFWWKRLLMFIWKICLIGRNIFIKLVGMGNIKKGILKLVRLRKKWSVWNVCG